MFQNFAVILPERSNHSLLLFNWWITFFKHLYSQYMTMYCIELYWLCKHMKQLRSSQTAILVIDWVKQQFFPVSIVKKSISKINRKTDATDNSITETTNLLRNHIELLLQENTSKNTIIKILAENQQHASNTKEVVSSESFKTVKGTFLKNCYNPKSQNVVYSNRYATL